MTYLKTIALSVLLIKFLLITNLYAHDEKLMPGGRPDSHAPIGVMGDHMHKEGEYMISYRYMNKFLKVNTEKSLKKISKNIIFHEWIYVWLKK